MTNFKQIIPNSAIIIIALILNTKKYSHHSSSLLVEYSQDYFYRVSEKKLCKNKVPLFEVSKSNHIMKPTLLSQAFEYHFSQFGYMLQSKVNSIIPTAEYMYHHCLNGAHNMRHITCDKW